jgi:hypothetical protein
VLNVLRREQNIACNSRFVSLVMTCTIANAALKQEALQHFVSTYPYGSDPAFNERHAEFLLDVHERWCCRYWHWHRCLGGGLLQCYAAALAPEAQFSRA